MATGVPSYVTASDATVKKLAQQFLGVEETQGPARRAAAEGQAAPKRPREPATAGSRRRPSPGKDQAIQAIQQGAGGQLPVYYPTVRAEELAVHRPAALLQDHDPRRQAPQAATGWSLKRGLVGEYYGIQGTTWKNPPILDSAVRRRGRWASATFELHYDGDRLRLVAWRTPKAVYWVSNTLLQTLTERQMLAIARSTRLP